MQSYTRDYKVYLGAQSLSQDTCTQKGAFSTYRHIKKLFVHSLFSAIWTINFHDHLTNLPRYWIDIFLQIGLLREIALAIVLKDFAHLLPVSYLPHIFHWSPTLTKFSGTLGAKRHRTGSLIVVYRLPYSLMVVYGWPTVWPPTILAPN